jgi:DnaJ-class molecular chaperone
MSGDIWRDEYGDWHAFRTCQRCNGDGGPPAHWDDEIGRWHQYICGLCGGSGVQRGWFDTRADALGFVKGEG